MSYGLVTDECSEVADIVSVLFLHSHGDPYTSTGELDVLYQHEEIKPIDVEEGVEGVGDGQDPRDVQNCVDRHPEVESGSLVMDVLAQETVLLGEGEKSPISLEVGIDACHG